MHRASSSGIRLCQQNVRMFYGASCPQKQDQAEEKLNCHSGFTSTCEVRRVLCS